MKQHPPTKPVSRTYTIPGLPEIGSLVVSCVRPSTPREYVGLGGGGTGLLAGLSGTTRVPLWTLICPGIHSAEMFVPETAIALAATTNKANGLSHILGDHPPSYINETSATLLVRKYALPESAIKLLIGSRASFLLPLSGKDMGSAEISRPQESFLKSLLTPEEVALYDGSPYSIRRLLLHVARSREAERCLSLKPALIAEPLEVEAYTSAVCTSGAFSTEVSTAMASAYFSRLAAEKSAQEQAA